MAHIYPDIDNPIVMAESYPTRDITITMAEIYAAQDRTALCSGQNFKMIKFNGILLKIN